MPSLHSVVGTTDVALVSVERDGNEGCLSAVALELQYQVAPRIRRRSGATDASLLPAPARSVPDFPLVRVPDIALRAEDEFTVVSGLVHVELK